MTNVEAGLRSKKAWWHTSKMQTQILKLIDAATLLVYVESLPEKLWRHLRMLRCKRVGGDSAPSADGICSKAKKKAHMFDNLNMHNLSSLYKGIL